MSENVFHRAIYLTGPTASGKTAVGVALARLLDAEILALDSMTLYRGMDIATAKPTLAERGGIAHHLIDVIDPWESASVSAYRNWAAKAAGEIEARGKRILFVGGTPLYLKALLRGLFQGPGADQDFRLRLERDAAEHGDAALHRRLAALRPHRRRPAFIPTTSRRIVRAARGIRADGPADQSTSSRARSSCQPLEVPVFAFGTPLAASLHQRHQSNAWFSSSTAGLVEEVRSLQTGPQPLCIRGRAGDRIPRSRHRHAGRGSVALQPDNRAGPGTYTSVRQALPGDLVSWIARDPGSLA